MREAYRSQVALLVKVLPQVAEEHCLALHGGTAINLFVRDMPRLSVDLDLTYRPLEDRRTSLERIERALSCIGERIEREIPDAGVEHVRDEAKLYVSRRGARIKLEVNLVMRGTLEEPVRAGSRGIRGLRGNAARALGTALRRQGMRGPGPSAPA